jgi:hypothetical protein
MAKRGQDLSKQLYKFQEGITAIALELAGIPESHVHWPATARPDGLTVDVDVLVGPSPESATSNISVKHLVSGKEAEKGGWRMMREIIDSKSNCPANIGIYNVVFDSQLKSAWETILAAFFDDLVLLEKEPPYGPVLVAKAYEYCTGLLAKVGDAKVRDLLRSAASDKKSKIYDIELAAATCLYGKRLTQMLGKSAKGLETFWERVKTSCAREIPSVTIQTTSLKRGLAKLAIFEPRDRAKIYEHVTKFAPLRDLPLFALHLKLAQEGAEEDWEIIDQDILRVFTLLKYSNLPSFSGADSDIAEVCEYIFAHSPMDRMEELYIRPLRRSSHSICFYQFIIDNFAGVTKPDSLRALLVKCFNNPSALLGKYHLDEIETSMWLFPTLISIIKMQGGTLQSAGLGPIVSEAGIDAVEARFQIPAFTARDKMPNKELLNKLSVYFSSSLKRYGLVAVETTKSDALDYYRQRLLETQLIPYRDFDPIGVLLKRELSALGLKWVHHQSHSTSAKEFAGTSSGGTTKALEVKTNPPSLILWQSPNKNARDKAKEFAARAACLVSRFDTESNIFVDRCVRVFMVIDGIWDAEDVRALLRFGCEGVYYPDQLDKLLEAISPTTAVSEAVDHPGRMIFPEEDLAMAAENDVPPKLKRVKRK